MASEATKMAVWGNMHNDIRVIEVADFKLEVKFDHWGYWGYLEAKMASGNVKMAVLGNIHMNIRVIEVSDFKSDVKYWLMSSLTCIVARSSKGPLPSGYFVKNGARASRESGNTGWAPRKRKAACIGQSSIMNNSVSHLCCYNLRIRKMHVQIGKKMPLHLV